MPVAEPFEFTDASGAPNGYFRYGEPNGILRINVKLSLRSYPNPSIGHFELFLLSNNGFVFNSTKKK